MALEDRVQAVSYAVRPRVVARHVGQISLVIAVASVVPLLFATLARDWRHATSYAVVVGVLALGGWLLGRIPAKCEVQPNEALVIVCLAFVLAPLLLAFPMMGDHVGYLDALFEAVSGITTTGLSTLATVENQPHSLLFTAAWLQWLGGLGIIVLSYALLFSQGINAKRLAGVLGEDVGLLGGTRAYALVILRIYAGLTIIGVAVLWLSGADLFGSLTLAFASISTGGFSPYNDSIAGLAHATQIVVMVLCVAGAISMPLYHRVLRGNWRPLVFDVEVRALLILGVITTVILAANLWATGDLPLTSIIPDALITAFSAHSTAGFASVPVNSLNSLSKLVLVIAMAIGGGVGSSAGGIKLLRFLILLRVIHLLLLRTRLTEHTMLQTELGERTWPDAELVRILAMVMLFVAVILVSWLIFVAYGYDPLNALFEVTSASATVGLSTGITRPELQPLLKGVLCVDMLLGRLEIVAVLVLCAPSTWIGQRKAC